MPDSYRYVIVYRDGLLGPADYDREASDRMLRRHAKENLGPYAPAYRIRIREKAKQPAPLASLREAFGRPDNRDYVTS